MFLENFPSPYSGLSRARGELSRVSSDVPHKDIEFVKKVVPERGVILRLGQLLFASVVADMKGAGITYYSPQNIRLFNELIERKLTAGLGGGCPVASPFGHSADGHDARPVEGAHPETAGGFVERDNSQVADCETESGEETNRAEQQGAVDEQIHESW